MNIDQSSISSEDLRTIQKYQVIKTSPSSIKSRRTVHRMTVNIENLFTGPMSCKQFTYLREVDFTLDWTGVTERDTVLILPRVLFDVMGLWNNTWKNRGHDRCEN